MAKPYGSVRRAMAFIKKHSLVVIYSRRRDTFICPERRKDVNCILNLVIYPSVRPMYSSLLPSVVYTPTLYPSQGFFLNESFAILNAASRGTSEANVIRW